MANPEHLEILKQGVEVWNKWRKSSRILKAEIAEAELHKRDGYKAYLTEAYLRGADLINIDLSGADLTGANLTNTDFYKANLAEANLSGSNLWKANLIGAELNKTNLEGANLCDADLRNVNFISANLRGANLRNVDLTGANFSRVDLTNADLSDANLNGALFIQAEMQNTILNNCNIYGISIWGIKGKIGEQKNLVITPPDQSEVIVDNIKVAQFIYLLLENKEIRDVLDTLTAKAVLILGRFTDERKKVLDSLKECLRGRGYLPILFDFDKPGSRNLTETIKTLAGISRFVIADLTDAKAVIHELMAIIPHYPSIPIQPLLLATQEEYGMFEDFRPYPWVCGAYQYDSPEMLLANLEIKVIDPAERKVIELKGNRP